MKNLSALGESESPIRKEYGTQRVFPVMIYTTHPLNHLGTRCVELRSSINEPPNFIINFESKMERTGVIDPSSSSELAGGRSVESQSPMLPSHIILGINKGTTQEA